MKPFVFINCAMTLDGKISTIERKQVRISNEADMKRVDELRASSDAILVGMTTVLVDDPKLVVKSEELRKRRVEKGLSENPVKVTIGRIDTLSPESEFLCYGNSKVLIFAYPDSDKERVEELKSKAEVFMMEDKEDLSKVMNTLAKRGIKRLMVEGGGRMNFELLQKGLVDEVYVSLAPRIFGGSKAPTLVDGNGFKEGEAVELESIGMEELEDILILRYRVKH